MCPGRPAAHDRWHVHHRRFQQPLPAPATRRRADAIVEVRRTSTSATASTEVLRGISFTVEAGELFGLLGTNGAGKTTTVEILQGLRSADAGRVEVLGLDPAVAGDRLRRRIGGPAPGRGPARPHAGGRGPAPVRLPAPVAPAARRAGRASGSSTTCGDARSARCRAASASGCSWPWPWSAGPELVFLDELTQNLDPVGRRRTWDVVRRIRDGGTTVVLVTHDVEEAERLCDRVVVLDRGRVVADGTPASIVDELGATTTVSFTDADLDVRTLRRLPGVERVDRHGPEVRVTAPARCWPTSAPTWWPSAGPPLDLRAQRPSLEDRFVALTQEASS